MPKCYLVSLRLPEVGVIEREALTPVGTLLDRTSADFIDILPHVEMVAKRSYHKIQSEMADPMTMENEFHKFVHANKTETTKYGNKLVGFFPVTHCHRTVSRSATDDRIASVEAYLVYVVDDNHEVASA